jgi:hypothetical protein
LSRVEAPTSSSLHVYSLIARYIVEHLPAGLR